MNNYARLETNLKTDIAGVSGTTGLDTAFVRLADSVSREFDAATGRRFSAHLSTKYMRGSCRTNGAYLWLPDDLASITSVVVDDDGDGAYELTLVADTDFWGWPYDAAEKNEPYYRLELNPNGTQLWRWPTHPRSVKITGLWGYSYELQSTGLTVSAISSTTTTSVTVSATAAAIIFPGDTLVVDSEQMEVTAVSSTALTVTRGINGTTAATHSNGAAAYIRRYPREVEERVSERVVGLRWDSQSGFAGSATLIGDVHGAAGTTQARASYARWVQAINHFKRLAVV